MMSQSARGSISVIVGCYNGEKYVLQQLNSLINQSRLPFEIIIADDGSSDRTQQIISAFADENMGVLPIKVVKNEKNLGFGENFINAAALAEGEFVAFCDQDDVWHGDKLAVCEAEFADPEVVLVVHQANLIDQSGQPFGIFDQGIRSDLKRPPLRYDPWRCFAGFTMVFRCQLLSIVASERRCGSYLSPALKLEHDRWIMYLANLVGCTKELAKPLADYRQHDTNLFGARRSTPMDFPSYLRSAIEQRQLIDNFLPDATAMLPLFDRKRSEAFWDNAGRMMRARSRLRDASSSVGSLRIFIGSVLNGSYMNDFNRRPRWGAMARDLKFICRAGRE